MSWLNRKLNRWGLGRRILWPEGRKTTGTFYENDNDFHRRYEHAVKQTNASRGTALRRMRFYSLEKIAQQVVDVPGDACEVGCFRGLSAYIAAGVFERAGKKLTFHICDSFEGLSAPTSDDVASDGKSASQIITNAYSCSEENVRKHLSCFNFFAFHKGWIPEPFKSLANERFCYAHIDVDLYDPTRDSIEFLWPRLNPRGAMIFDDYGSTHYPGARKAIDGFFKGRTDAFLVENPAGGAVAIKS